MIHSHAYERFYPHPPQEKWGFDMWVLRPTVSRVFEGLKTRPKF